MTPQREIVSGILLAVIAGGYALYLALAVKEENINRSTDENEPPA
jgi:hypothetical protein